MLLDLLLGHPPSEVLRIHYMNMHHFIVLHCSTQMPPNITMLGVSKDSISTPSIMCVSVTFSKLHEHVYIPIVLVVVQKIVYKKNYGDVAVRPSFMCQLMFVSKLPKYAFFNVVYMQVHYLPTNYCCDITLQLMLLATIDSILVLCVTVFSVLSYNIIMNMPIPIVFIVVQ